MFVFICTKLKFSIVLFYALLFVSAIIEKHSNDKNKRRKQNVRLYNGDIFTAQMNLSIIMLKKDKKTTFKKLSSIESSNKNFLT